MMGTKGLSINEKRVLYAITQFSSALDKDLYSVLDMKKSTFSAIKRRLYKRGFFRIMRVPTLSKLGMELLFTVYTVLNRNTSINQRLTEIKSYFDKTPEIAYVISEANRAFLLLTTQNYSKYDKIAEYVSSRYHRMGYFDPSFSEKGFNTSIFPFKNSEIYSLFHYGPFLKRLFKLQPLEGEDNLMQEPLEYFRDTKKAELSTAEGKVLVGLIDYPQLPDQALAEKINLSRNTVAKARKRLFDEMIVTDRVIPDITKLDLEIMILAHFFFNPERSEQERKEAAQIAQKEITPFVHIQKGQEGIMLAAFSSYAEYQKIFSNSVLDIYTQSQYIQREPKTFVYSAPSMTFVKDFTFKGIIENYVKLK